MDYIEINIPVQNSELSEIITAELSDFPFEGFEDKGELLKGYMPQLMLADYKDKIDAILASYNITGARYISIETKNWNEQWESNFSQVEISDKILIRAPFHPSSEHFEHEIVIMPKMSFGTGHHATTHLMSLVITELGVLGKKGLDMGSGTGVLSIIAVKYGAEAMDAIDIDEWADENCRENIVQNGVEGRVTPMLGDARVLKGRSYDFVLANINCNILLSDMEHYVSTLSAGGSLVISGFFVSDIAQLRAKAESLGLTFTKQFEKDGWAAVWFSF